MATQGIVSVTSAGRTVLKVVAGCDGRAADRLAASLAAATAAGSVPSAAETYLLAEEAGFGCPDCLVVLTPAGDCHCTGELGPRYRETFGDPEFNPRWELGTADCVRVVEMGA